MSLVANVPLDAEVDAKTNAAVGIARAFSFITSEKDSRQAFDWLLQVSETASVVRALFKSFDKKAGGDLRGPLICLVKVTKLSIFVNNALKMVGLWTCLYTLINQRQRDYYHLI